MMTLAWTPSRVRAAWRLPFAITLGLQLLLLLVYRDTAAAMVEIWVRSETFTHCFVVPPIVAWLVWRLRGELAPLQPRPVPSLLLPLTGLALLWWLGQVVVVAAAMQLALVAMLVTTVPLLLGWQTTRVLAFPLAFLLFAVPIGEFMTPTLMHWTAEALVAGLRLTGIPVYQEGQHLVIPSGRWAVVEACSGVRYLMATFMVGSLFAYLNYRSRAKQATFIVISLLLPVVANWVRAYAIVMLGHLSDNKIATGVDHLVYGWVFFGVVILALFFIGARWADPDDLEEQAAAADRHAIASPQAPVPSWRPAALGAIALAAVVWPTLLLQHDGSAALQAPVRLVLPGVLGRWQATATSPTAWAPHFPTASLRQAQAYAGSAGSVVVHVDYYRGQRGDVKLVSSTNGFVPSPMWHVVSEGEAVVQVGGQSMRWRRALLTTVDGDNLGTATRPRLTVWRLYWLGGPVTRSDVGAKLLQAWGALRGEPDDGAAIHLVSALPDEAAAEQQLATFVGENFTPLAQALSRARAGH